MSSEVTAQCNLACKKLEQSRNTINDHEKQSLFEVSIEIANQYLQRALNYTELKCLLKLLRIII